MSAVTRLFGVLLSASEAGLWSQKSLVSVFQVARFAPVSHHCFWLSPLTGNERFILSGLNYIVPPDLVLTACPRSKPEGNRHTGGRGRNCRGEGQAIRTGKKKKKDRSDVKVKCKCSASAFWGAGKEIRSEKLQEELFACLFVCLSASRCCRLTTTVWRNGGLKFKSDFWKASQGHLGGGKVWLISRMHQSVSLIFNLR